MRIFYKFLLLLYFVLPQLALGVNSITRHRRSATKKCGNPGNLLNKMLIFGDKSFILGDFPWMVALTKNVRHQVPGFFGAGTLVSSRHVITAAHCIKHKFDHSELKAHELIALFGVHTLSNLLEAGTIALSPITIKVHPDWNSSDTRYDADIAMMTFEAGEIPSSRFIQPICLWNGATPPLQTEGHFGGWGMNWKSENAYENIPTKLKVPIHTDEFCFLTTKDLVDFTSNRTFCAGGGDGTGVREGDGGGGLLIKDGSVFYLRGIVSSALVDEYEQIDLTKFAIFTDVLKFKPWIDKIMRKDGKILECNSEHHSYRNLLGSNELQTCNINDQEIDGEGFSVAGDPNINVQALSIEDNKEVKFLPENIDESFPALIVFRVFRCSIRTISGKHFKGLKNLERLELQGNEIESIDGDSFKDLTKLEKLYLDYNKIKTVDPNLFQSLGNIWELWICCNQIEHLDAQIFDILQNVREIGLHNNKLSTIPANLLNNNLKLVEIRLHSNKIRAISATMFDHLFKLTYVDLRNNVCVKDFFYQNRFNEMENDLRTNCALPF